MANKVNFEIGFSVNKSGLQEMQSLFQQISNKAKEPANAMNTGLQQAAKTATALDGILEKTFNTNLGTLNVTKFNQEMSKAGLTLKSVKTDLSSAGNQGATAFNRLSQAILGTNLQLKQSNKALDQMFITFKNTIRYGISSSIFNNVTNSIQKAYSYSRDLNSSLNDIRIVTDKSAESMEKFAGEANSAAKALGASTLDYTNASLIYYQQGLSDEETKARTETTLKAANITGQSSAAVSEQLTAVWNGYKVTAEETELYVDKLAAVAATTAADLEELSTGMSKVASAANAMGVDFDDLNAQIATIVSITRQAPESVGTALKTIYARLGDLKVDGVDEFGVKLGEVSAQLQTMGIQILDQNGNMRDMTSIMAEVAEKWNTQTEAQRQAAAVAMAGKRQYNNLIALFDNWDMYSKALETSANAMGTLQHQQDIYMESTEAKLQKLKTTWQELYGDLINTDELQGGIEAITNLVKVLDNFVASFGGGIKTILGFGAIIANVFNKQIADSINSAIQRQEVFKQNLALAQANAESRVMGVADAGENASAHDVAAAANSKVQLEYAEKIYQARVGLNQEQYNTLIGYQKEIGALEEQKVLTKELAERTELKYLTDREIADILNADINELEEIAVEYAQIEDYAADQLEIAQYNKQAILEEIDSNKKLSSIKREIETILEGTTSAEEQQVRLIVEEATSIEKLKGKRSEILSLLNKVINQNKKNVQNIAEEEKAVDRVVKAREKIVELEEQKNNIEQQAKGMLDLANNAKTVVQNVTSVTSALGSMAMAQSSVNSLISTQEDDSASFGDKITQSLMTLGFTIPMVISSQSKLNEVLGISNAIEEGLLATKGKRIAAEQLEQAQKEISIIQANKKIALDSLSLNYDKALVLTYLKEASAEELKAVGSDKAAAAQLAQNIADKHGVVLGKERTAVLAELIIAENAETAATEAETVAQESLNAAMAANPIGLIIIGIAAAVAAIAGLVKIIDLVTINAEEAIEELNKSKEELKSIQSEISNLNKELETTQSRIKELEEKGPLTVLEEQELTKLKATNQLLENQLQTKKELEKIALRETASKVKQSTEKGNYEVNSAFSGKVWSSTLESYSGENYKYSLDNLDYDNIDKFKEAVTEKINLALQDVADKSLNENAHLDAQAAVNFYDDILNQLDDPGSSLNKDQAEQLSSIDTNYAEAMELLPQFYNNNENGEFNEVIKQLEDNVLRYYKAHDLLVNSVQMAFNDSFEDNQKINELYNKSNEFINEELQTVDENKLKEVLDEDTFNKLKIQSETYGISLYNILTTAKDFNIQITEETEQVVLTIQEKIEKLTANIENVNSIINSLLKGDKLSDDQLKALDKLEEEYKELNTIQDRSSKDYLNKLLEIREALEKEQIALKKIAETEIIDETLQIDVKSDGGEEELQNKLKEICEADYSILVEIKSDIQDDFDTTVSAMKSIEDMASKIGDDFKISAEDIEELNSVFPGILTNMEFLEDGSVKLNSEIVKGAMEAADAEVSADTDATIKKLQNQADELAARRDAAKDIAKIAQDLAKGSEISAKQETDLNKALNKLKSDNSEKVSIQQQDDEINVAETAAESATSMANSFEGAYKNMSINAAEQARIAHQALLSATEKGVEPPIGDFAGASFSTTADITKAESNKADLNNFEDYSDVSNQQAVADYYNNLAESYDEAYNSVLGKIGELAARGNKVNKTLKNISKGFGSDGKKDKSSSSKDKKEDKKEQEDEFDRYQEIKKAIDAVDRALKKLDKDKENLYGYELINALQQENQLLEQQAANYETLYEMQQQEAAELREQLGTMGLMFDASGAITNYAAATSAALAQYSAAIEQYNAGLIDETTLKVYEKAYENFKKLLERYDKLYYTEMQDTQEKLDEIVRKQKANNLKAQEIEIQIHLDAEKVKRDQNDFLKDIKQDFRKVYKDLTIDVKYDEKNFKSLVNDVNTTLKAISDVEAEIDKMVSGGSSDMFESVSQAQEKLKELQEKLLEQGKDLYALYKQVWQTYLDGIDQVKDKFEQLMSLYEHFNKTLEFQKNLIELLYGDKAYDLMDQYYETQEKNTLAQIDSLKQQRDMQEDQFKKVYKGTLPDDFSLLDTSTQPEDMKNFDNQTEDMKKFYDEAIESQESLNDLIIDAVELLQNKYLNSMNQIIDAANQAMYGMSFDDMKSDQEQTQKLADLFLDDVQKAYKIQTLANKMDQDISKTSSLKAQQKLQKLREEEIEYLRTKENLTQEDINLAEERYQIALKEIALEDAQQNKTSMKLTRNEQGNQSYQYVADEDDVASKQQDLLSTMGDYYEKSVDYRNKSLEEQTAIKQQELEELANIEFLYADNIELAQQKRQEILEKYEPILNALLENTEVARREAISITSQIFGTVCEQDRAAYETLTNEQKRMVDEQKELSLSDFREVRQYLIGEDGLYTELGKAAEEAFEATNFASHSAAAQMAKEQAKNPDSFKNIILKAIDDMNKATQNYEKELNKLQEIAGMDFSKLGEYINQVSQNIDAMEGTTEKMVDNSSAYLEELRRVLEAIADAQNSVIGRILDAQNAMQEYINLAAQARAASAAANSPSNPGTGPGVSPGNGGNGGNTPGKPGDEGSEQGKSTIQYLDSTRVVSPTANGYQEEELTYANSKDSNIKDTEIRRTNYSFRPFIGKARGTFDTGGYTGEQADGSGKLAILHSKELVLNAKDTANFLEGISMLRDMSSINGSISNAILSAIGNMALTLGNTKAGTGSVNSITNSDAVENNVFNITAEFPNANDVNDIREAILSLPNYVSQYVGRNVR